MLSGEGKTEIRVMCVERERKEEIAIYLETYIREIIVNIC